MARIVGIDDELDWETLEQREDDSAIVLAYLGELLNSLVMLLMGALPDVD